MGAQWQPILSACLRLWWRNAVHFAAWFRAGCDAAALGSHNSSAGAVNSWLPLSDSYQPAQAIKAGWCKALLGATSLRWPIPLQDHLPGMLHGLAYFHLIETVALGGNPAWYPALLHPDLSMT